MAVFRQSSCHGLIAAVVLIGYILPTAPAQDARLPLQIEVMIQPSTSQQLATQEWARVFQTLERRATFRSGRNGERTRVETEEFRGRKSVLAVGLMNRDGSLSFGAETFRITQPEVLQAWLEKLEQFGPGGPPDENPTWGLTEDQFRDVLKKLSKPVPGSVDLSSVSAITKSIALPPDLPIRLTEAGQRQAVAASGRKRSLAGNPMGLSQGSMLAVSLAHLGLGFRPKVHGDTVYLEIDAGTEDSNMYPVGWKNTDPITTVLPAISKLVPVELEDANLDALIRLIAQKLDLQHFYSEAALRAAGLDVENTKYSRKPDKLSMFHLMEIVGTANHLGLSIRTDEAGKLFLWVTTEAEEKAFEKRFAHIRVNRGG